MKSVLCELHTWIAQEERGYYRDSEYVLMNDQIKKEREYIISKLSPEDSERLIKLETLYTATSDIDEVESFRMGFKLAALIMTEVYS